MVYIFLGAHLYAFTSVKSVWQNVKNYKQMNKQTNKKNQA